MELGGNDVVKAYHILGVAYSKKADQCKFHSIFKNILQFIYFKKKLIQKKKNIRKKHLNYCIELMKWIKKII